MDRQLNNLRAIENGQDFCLLVDSIFLLFRCVLYFWIRSLFKTHQDNCRNAETALAIWNISKFLSNYHIVRGRLCEFHKHFPNLPERNIGNIFKKLKHHTLEFYLHLSQCSFFAIQNVSFHIIININKSHFPMTVTFFVRLTTALIEDNRCLGR